MKLYQKKIEDYKKNIQEQYIRESSIRRVVEQCDNVVIESQRVKTSYYEFIYTQSKFIKKSWWGLQGCVLILLWCLLKDAVGVGDVERRLGSLATLFVILIIPEIWKNRRFSAVEIERSSFYSLRHICAARTLLFAIVDLFMVTVFFVITYNTLQVSAYRMVMNFLIPFNVSVCICFRLLYSKWGEMEYVAVIVSVVWIVVWSVIVTRNSIYNIIAEPIWLGLLLLSFGYLIFCIRKSQFDCEIFMEDRVNGIKA